MAEKINMFRKLLASKFVFACGFFLSMFGVSQVKNQTELLDDVDVSAFSNLFTVDDVFADTGQSGSGDGSSSPGNYGSKPSDSRPPPPGCPNSFPSGTVF